MRLNTNAKEMLANAGVTQVQWTRRHFGPEHNRWPGDACGCPDDRCIGYHHGTGEDCACLPALLDSMEADVATQDRT